jgi:hypothetical protein
MLETSPLGYLRPSPEVMQNHVCELPCGGLSEDSIHEWTIPELEYYVSYYANKKRIDKMFNGFIFNAVSVQKDRYIHPMYVGFGEAATRTDWEQWIDSLFAPGKNFKALYLLAMYSPVDVWVSIPYPYLNQTNFGEVNGKNLNFQSVDDRFTAVSWWIDQFMQRWNKESKLAEKLKLRGFLWQRESIHDYDEKLVQLSNRYVKDKGFYTMWLPYFGSYGCTKLSELNFDVVVPHPNYYGKANFDFQAIHNACAFAKQYHTGLQIIFGKGLIYNDTHVLDYLNLGLPEFNQYMTQSFLVYRFPNQTMKEICETRINEYIYLYQFIKGIYVKVVYPNMRY